MGSAPSLRSELSCVAVTDGRPLPCRLVISISLGQEDATDAVLLLRDLLHFPNKVSPSVQVCPCCFPHTGLGPLRSPVRAREHLQAGSVQAEARHFSVGYLCKQQMVSHVPWDSLSLQRPLFFSGHFTGLGMDSERELSLVKLVLTRPRPRPRPVLPAWHAVSLPEGRVRRCGPSRGPLPLPVSTQLSLTSALLILDCAHTLLAPSRPPAGCTMEAGQGRELILLVSGVLEASDHGLSRSSGRLLEEGAQAIADALLVRSSSSSSSDRNWLNNCS